MVVASRLSLSLGPAGNAGAHNGTGGMTPSRSLGGMRRRWFAAGLITVLMLTGCNTRSAADKQALELEEQEKYACTWNSDAVHEFVRVLGDTSRPNRFRDRNWLAQLEAIAREGIAPAQVPMSDQQRELAMAMRDYALSTVVALSTGNLDQARALSQGLDSADQEFVAYCATFWDEGTDNR